MLTKLSINGVDFTPYLKAGGLSYGWVTRQSRAIVTLDGTKHMVEVRRRKLGVTLIKMRDAAERKLEAAKIPNPATVVYTERDGSEATKTCYILEDTATASQVRGGNTYYDGVSFVLEEK